MADGYAPALRVVDTLHLAFTIPSTQEGEWGVLVPHGRVWWYLEHDLWRKR